MTPSRTIRRVQIVCSVLLVGLLAPVLLRAQGRVEGQIVNGTTQRPVANQKVLLLAPRQGMQQIAEASTDASGHFAFTQNNIDPASFYLLQANFQGVPYHAPVQFGSAGAATVNLPVFDSTHDPSSLRVSLLRILAGAEGQKIRVQEEYNLENSSQPGRTYANPDGTFIFHLSPQAGEPKVTVTGLMNMALPQALEHGKAPGDYKISYPVKPGTTTLTVNYDADYSTTQFSINDRTSFPIDHAELFVIPASLKVESKDFKSAGTDTANNIQFQKFEAGSFPRGATLEAALSGEAAINSLPEDNSAEGTVKPVPNNMTRLGIPLFICFLLILLWALGIRVSKEWSRWKDVQAASPARKQLEAKADALFNSMADLDELFATGKIEKKKYWKERLELKAKLMALLKKGPPLHIEPYATRRNPR
ncbi:MAG: hypothetical protein ACYDA9_16675 [Terriglobia bacterium]